MPGDFENRLTAGQKFDVFVSTVSTVDRWIERHRLVATSRVELARSGIGVEVRAGTFRPDISSVDAFKRALLEEKSIAYLRVGSGIHMDRVVARLGIVVITQILTTPGVELVGPLPPGIQSSIVFAGAVAREARAPHAAKALLRFLSSATVVPIMRSQGMEPIEARGAAGGSKE